jgi:hypothetical protein
MASIDPQPNDDGRETPGSRVRELLGLDEESRPLSTPWPALDDALDMELGRPRFAVIALPWEPGGETPFHIAQAAAKQAANPLCLFPSWSPHWDGTLNVSRDAELPDTVDYTSLAVKGGRYGMVIVDQFSRLHWHSVSSHAQREEVVSCAGKDILELSRKASIPVLVVLRRKKDSQLTIGDLRSDGALEYDADVVAMVDPDHRTASATLRVAKSRYGPTGTWNVEWPVLPRTVYLPAARS